MQITTLVKVQKIWLFDRASFWWMHSFEWNDRKQTGCESVWNGKKLLKFKVIFINFFSLNSMK